MVAFARLRDDVLANWIEQHVAFPCSMVDRITPQTTDAERDLVADEFGIADRWPVVAEPFCQWVLEDTFVDGRPSFQEVGVQMVSDVTPYEAMKIRLLNGSHVAIGYLAALAGYRTVDQVMADARFREFVERFMRDEVAPLLPPVPGVDLDAYQQTLVVRFSNPHIADQVARICLDGSTKMPRFLIPSLRDALATGRPHALLTLALAGWLRYLTAVDDAVARSTCGTRVPTNSPIARPRGWRQSTTAAGPPGPFRRPDREPAVRRRTRCAPRRVAHRRRVRHANARPDRLPPIVPYEEPAG